MRLTPLVALKTAVLMNIATLPLWGDETKSAPKNPDVSLTLRLLDEAEKPVANAHAGYFVLLRDFQKETAGTWKFLGGVTSNANGVAVAHQEPGRPFIYARHAKLGLVGIGKIKDKRPDGSLSVRMHPECVVSFRLTSSQLEKIGRKIERPVANVGADNGDGRFLLGFFYAASDSTLRAYLPPGTFEFWCNGTNVCGVPKEVTVKPGERKLDLGNVDLPAQRHVLLEGKPAPELDDVLAWKNGPPLKLADLHGKVVLLEFWGWWCGPCVARGIPEMVKLQEEFRGKELVIVGVHTPAGENDKITSVKKLDDQLAKVRQKFWKGKDFTFPVVLTRGRKGSYYVGGPEMAVSKTCFDYGIDRWPSTVLIDRKGNVVGLFHASKKEDRDKLRALLQSH